MHYLETHRSYVIPTEEDELLCVSSMQAPTKHQEVIAGCLGIPAHKVVSKTKRLGGRFGGKETRATFGHVACAVAAYHTSRCKKPTRASLWVLFRRLAFSDMFCHSPFEGEGLQRVQKNGRKEGSEYR